MVINEDETHSIKSITMGQILANLYASIDAAFLKLRDLLIVDCKTTRTLIMTTFIVGYFRCIQNLNWMIHLRLQSLLKIYDEAQYNYHLLVKPDVELFIMLSMSDTTIGIKNLIEEQIKISHTFGPPSIIARNTSEPCEIGSTSIFPDSKPNYIINIGKK